MPSAGTRTCDMALISEPYARYSVLPNICAPYDRFGKSVVGGVAAATGEISVDLAGSTL